MNWSVFPKYHPDNLLSLNTLAHLANTREKLPNKLFLTYGIVEYNDNLRREYQTKMKNIRLEWESKGYQFSKLDWETWTGK